MSPTDIAIIGLACRFPAAAGPRDFWHVVRDGREVTQLRATSPSSTQTSSTCRRARRVRWTHGNDWRSN